MEFTQEQKHKYLDRLALATQEGIWLTEMALMKDKEKLSMKKALLTVIEQKIANKEYNPLRDGKNEKKYTEDKIAELEHEIETEQFAIETGKTDLEMIESYRNKSV